MKGTVEAYRALSEICLRGCWIGEAVKREGRVLHENKGVLRLVYGVVEREYLYRYRISRLAEKSPKPSVAILLKMGMYLVDESEIPSYAAVNEIVALSRSVGKGGVSGFVNAFLRRYVEEGASLYPEEEEALLSVKANLPIWLVRRYIGELGKERAITRLLAPRSAKTHVRPSIAFGKEGLRAALIKRGIEYEETAHGFFLQKVGEIADLLREGCATVMSFGSLEIASAIPAPTGRILDLCAAPGGKSVYLAERYGREVIACDLYPHRVELIRSYASRMGVSSVKAEVRDGLLYEESFKGAFSTVLLDAPCSGLGSLASNPDIALHRTEEDLTALIDTQRKLLANAGEYVAVGGTLLYSTCSDLPSEDEEVVKDFLKTHPDFRVEREVYTDPTAGGGESYYYALMRKI